MFGRRGAVVVAIPGFALPAWADEPFSFTSVISLSEMQELIRKDFPVGTARDTVRAALVDQAGAMLKIHPTQAGVEKYIYDINLCSYYIWRWNSAADYDRVGKLKQIYINGERALPNGSPARVLPKVPPNQKAAIFKLNRPRPEAFKGESSLAAIIMDHDANLKTIDDQELTGVGPTRADPADMGKMHAYHVEPWRSIFDLDDAKAIVPYAGDCAVADFENAARKGVGQ